MRVTVTIPDDVASAAAQVAEWQGTARSCLYTRALTEYLERHRADAISEAINRAVDAVGDDDDGFSAAISRRQLGQIDW